MGGILQKIKNISYFTNEIINQNDQLTNFYLINTNYWMDL